MRVGIRRQIWSLPAIAVLIFGIGIAACVGFATQAQQHLGRVAGVDYPLLDLLKTLTADVQATTDDFNAAVAEGEKRKLEEAALHAERVGKTLASIGKLPGE